MFLVIHFSCRDNASRKTARKEMRSVMRPDRSRSLDPVVMWMSKRRDFTDTEILALVWHYSSFTF